MVLASVNWLFRQWYAFRRPEPRPAVSPVDAPAPPSVTE